MGGSKYIHRISDNTAEMVEAYSLQLFAHDLIYNPDQTLFMQKGAQYGAEVKNGLEMLLLQAFASWEFWNGKEK